MLSYGCLKCCVAQVIYFRAVSCNVLSAINTGLVLPRPLPRPSVSCCSHCKTSRQPGSHAAPVSCDAPSSLHKLVLVHIMAFLTSSSIRTCPAESCLILTHRPCAHLAPPLSGVCFRRQLWKLGPTHEADPILGSATLMFQGMQNPVPQ